MKYYRENKLNKEKNILQLYTTELYRYSWPLKQEWNVLFCFQSVIASGSDITTHMMPLLLAVVVMVIAHVVIR